ncbi:SH3 domain-containing protein [Streptomyces sp. NPDC051322]|uniref:SH3 domain-containing protein n=1 Tax=Streptomyces sp. NPDC051322 TaxID=3154645 RepID=UPI0034501F64
MNKLKRGAIATVVAGAAAFGGVVAIAPTASAAGSSTCTVDIANATYKTTTSVNLRTGPGAGYTSQGILATGTHFYGTCKYDTSYGVGVPYNVWTYGKVTSGANSGKWGWVSADYLKKA